jgi:hypothetical protein
MIQRAFGAASTRVPAATYVRPGGGPAILPPDDYYEAGGSVPEPLSRSVREGTRSIREHVFLPPRVPEALANTPLASNPIEILHFRPRGEAGPRPLILLSPILGNTTFVVERVARRFARAGLHAAVVQRKDLAFDPRLSVELAEDEVRLVVMRSRQALDWLLCRPDVDPARLGTFGASAGAIVSSMLAGADARLRAHVWLMAGGPLPDVMAHTVEGEYRRYRGAAMRATGLRLTQLRERLRSTLRTDPMHLASRVSRERVLMVLARFDRSVPYRYGLALWRALGRPERLLLPLGHYTTFLLLPWLEQVALDYYERTFGGRN